MYTNGEIGRNSLPLQRTCIYRNGKVYYLAVDISSTCEVHPLYVVRLVLFNNELLITRLGSIQRGNVHHVHKPVDIITNSAESCTCSIWVMIW